VCNNVDLSYLVSSDGTIHFFKLRKNDRYSFEKKFTKDCFKPRGICVASSRVYVCEPEKNEINEYTITKSGTGKILRRHGKVDIFLKQPIYVTAEITYDGKRLLISDAELGLKRMVIGERENNTSGWKSPKEEKFTPSKCCVNKSSVVVGDSSGRKLHFINFQTRNLSHQEYMIEDIFHSPVAIAVCSNQRYLIMACRDGSVVIYRTADLVEMEEMKSVEENEEPLYANSKDLT
jgi:hypothetical protein